MSKILEPCYVEIRRAIGQVDDSISSLEDKLIELTVCSESQEPGFPHVFESEGNVSNRSLEYALAKPLGIIKFRSSKVKRYLPLDCYSQPGIRLCAFPHGLPYRFTCLIVPKSITPIEQFEGHIDWVNEIWDWHCKPVLQLEGPRTSNVRRPSIESNGFVDLHDAGRFPSHNITPKVRKANPMAIRNLFNFSTSRQLIDFTI